jgi:hypothetical protein
MFSLAIDSAVFVEDHGLRIVMKQISKILIVICKNDADIGSNFPNFRWG